MTRLASQALHDTEILIAGGGLAGLYAALQLEHAGIDYRLLEAQPRFGGRILSLPAGPGDAAGPDGATGVTGVPAIPFAVDLGPTWFWPHQHRMRRLCAELQCTVFAQHVDGDVLYQPGGGRAVQRTGAGEGMHAYRLEGGMQSLVTAIVARLDPSRLHPGSPVAQVRRQDDGWRVTSGVVAGDDGAGAVFRAQQLVLAAPPRMLLGIAGLSQNLPAGFSATLAATPTWMAAQAKFVAVYPTPFWRNAGLSGQAFSRVGPMTEIHDASAGGDAGFALFGFVGVPAEVRGRHAVAALERACLDQLVDLFGVAAADPRTIRLQDWAREPWVASVADLREPPMHPALDLSPWRAALRRLQLDLVGSEVAQEEGGYLEGVLGSVETWMRSRERLTGKYAEK